MSLELKASELATEREHAEKDIKRTRETRGEDFGCSGLQEAGILIIFVLWCLVRARIFPLLRVLGTFILFLSDLSLSSIILFALC